MSPSSESRSAFPTMPVRVWALLLVVAVGLAYANSLGGVLVLDDFDALLENPSIRSLSPATVFQPPSTSGTAGRPLANLSFALSYALGGSSPWAHHAVNGLIHALSVLALFGVVRRTLLLPRWGGRFEAEAAPLAAAASLLWALHPVQTQVVTYLSQRTESLMALCYLLTLYAFIRGAAAPGWGRWRVVAVGAYLAGLLCKEVIATAPVLVFLYDRTFVSGSVRAAWAARRGFYLALASGWLWLAFLLAGVGERNVGFGLGVGGWPYLLAQCRSIVTYLSLAGWPHPLVFDRGFATPSSLAEVLPAAVAVVGLLAGSAWAVLRRPVAGFLAAWFLVILAPTTSFIPVALQPTAENRLHLPLAAVVVATVLLLRAGAGLRPALAVSAALGVAAGVTTVDRNRDYASALVLWTDTVAKVPASARAWNNLGCELERLDRRAEALRCYAHAVRLHPAYGDALSNLGQALLAEGRPGEALPHLLDAVRRYPSFPGALNNLGSVFLALGRAEEALPVLQEAVRLNPGFGGAVHNLGSVWERLGRSDEALRCYEEAVRLVPDQPKARLSLGNALVGAGRLEAGLEALREAVRLAPRNPDARLALGNACLGAGRLDEARITLEAALPLDPGRGLVANSLGLVLARQGRTDEAEAFFRRAIAVDPGLADPRNNLAVILVGRGRHAEAIAELEAALRIRPDYEDARRNLAALRAAR